MNDKQQMVAGVDFGLRDETTTLAIVNKDASSVEFIWRFKSNNSVHALHILQEKFRAHDPSVILVDPAAMGASNIEELQSGGFPVRGFHVTSKSKTFLLGALREALESGEIVFPTEHTRGAVPNNVKFALALAWYGAKYGGLLINFT